MKFELVDEKKVFIFDDGGKKIGQIFTPSSSGEDYKNVVQVCGFSEAFDIWGCGPFEKFKDIQLLFDGVEMVGKSHFDFDDSSCLRCYMRPCACEVKFQSRETNPFLLKTRHQLVDRIDSLNKI